MDITERTRKFESFWNYLKSSKDFDKLSLKKLLERAYNQACADCGQGASDISLEETQKILDTELFLSFVQNCIVHPEQGTLSESSDYVKVTYCEPDKCVGFPDRIEEMGCENNCGRTRIINLSKLCGIESAEESIKDKLLSSSEVEQISKALKELEDHE